MVPKVCDYIICKESGSFPIWQSIHKHSVIPDINEWRSANRIEKRARLILSHHASLTIQDSNVPLYLLRPLSDRSKSDDENVRDYLEVRQPL